MTLRDLTPRQMYNLQRRMEKERKIQWKKLFPEDGPDSITLAGAEKVWRIAYDKGLKAGLSVFDELIRQGNRNCKHIPE